MFGLEKVAQWWEGEQKTSEEFLQSWVNTSQSDFGLYSRAFVYTAVATSMTLGSGLVDVLRIGEGIKEGGWGYAKDSLRLLTFAGPFVKLGTLGLAKWTYNAPGNLCASVATSQVLRRTANKIFISAANIRARTADVSPIHIDQFMSTLLNLGVKVKQTRVSDLSKLKATLQANPRSVALIGVKWTDAANHAKGHALYAYLDVLGRLKIVNRNGKAVSSLKQLEGYHPGISTATMEKSILLVKESIIIQGSSMLSMLAIQVNAVMVKYQGGRKEVQITPVE